MPVIAPGDDHPWVTGLRNRLRDSRRLKLDLAIVAVLGLLIGNELLHFLGDGLIVRAGDVVFLTILGTLLILSNRERDHQHRDIDLDRARLVELIDSSPLATVVFDAAANVVTWNRTAEQLFGWRADEVIGRPNPIIPESDREASDALFDQMLAGERLHAVEVRRVARDGRELELAVSTAPLDRNSTLVLYDDIGERKQAERERDLANRRYQHLVESLPLVTYIDRADDRATNLYTSPQVVEILGWQIDDWESDPHLFEKIVHPDDAERVFAEVVHSITTHEVFDSEYRLRHRDGHYIWVHDQSAIVDDGAEPLARGFLLDITKQKRLEEQLQQAQKMDALGQFAGGIAHDFNNLLTGISGYAELAASASSQEKLVARCLEGIQTAASEAASLTARLLAFSRRNVPERRIVDLNDIVRDAAALLERLVRADVRVELSLAQPLPPVAADLAQLKQVVLNLALNARDAMPDGGLLTIETTTAGDSVLLRVRDNGIGMDASTRSRALEPFFTTKPEGEGTGLGLSVVYGVVDGLGGRLSIDSAIGLGTIVEIALPAADGLPDDPGAGDDEAITAHNAERVLIVEDRDVVRELTRDVLAASGFGVVAVAGGHEALAAAAAGEPFDLLLTDVVMPEMSGPELAVKLRAKYPDLPVLYMSGYTDDVLNAHELSQDATAFLRKPFANVELIVAARALLDDRPKPSAAPSAVGSPTPAARLT
jgi:PAS domain S-box-containing protein